MSIGAIIGISIGGVIILLLATFIFIGNYILYCSSENKKLKKQKESWTDLDPEMTSQWDEEWFNAPSNFVKHTIISKDKHHLNGFLHQEKGSHLYLIFAHGYGGHPAEKSAILKELQAKFKCNVFILEQRAQNSSEIKYLTMGAREAQDLSLWCSYLVNLDNDAKIILYGQSMGAASIMTSFLFNLPSNVKGAIEDCGYVNLRKQYNFSGANYAPKFLVNFVSFCMCISYLFHGANVFKHSPQNGLKKINVPLLAIHGNADQIVPYYNLALVGKYVNKDVTFISETFEGAHHTCSCVVDHDRYMKLVISFIENCTKNK